uniref:Uncharacterized protein n=1 Tax=Arundo donax TaxID=35708 RepID=A0A0A9F633_ARUDO
MTCLHNMANMKGKCFSRVRPVGKDEHFISIILFTHAATVLVIHTPQYGTSLAILGFTSDVGYP